MAIVQSLQPNAQRIAEFPVPYKGTWRSLGSNQITPDALYDSLNVFIRQGKLRTRPGLSLLNTTVFDNPVIGGGLAIDSSGKTLLAITKTQLYTLLSTDSTWQADLGNNDADFAPTSQDIIDTTFIETSSTYVALIAQEDRVLKAWDKSTGLLIDPIVASPGTVPTAKSVCTASRRIIALVAPHTLVWSSVFDYTSWPALATTKVAQTNDDGVCVLPIGTLDFVLYKERSIYLGKAQAGPDSSAFAVRYHQTVEGPAGVHAVVDALGLHFYMTSSGRIGVFDGARAVQWIADGLWFYLQGDLDVTYAYKIFGVYDYRLHSVVFYYPRTGDSGDLKGIVWVNLPLEGSGVNNFISFLGLSGVPVSYGYEQRFSNEINRGLVFSSTPNDEQSFLLDEDTDKDDDRVYDCLAQTSLQPVGDLKSSFVLSESFLERTEGNGSVNVFTVTSDVLDTASGNVDISIFDRVNLEFSPVKEYIGHDINTRFAGLKYQWKSTSNVRYAGALMYGVPLG